MTNLHRIIGYLAAMLVELAMAGAFGAAPTVVLDIPTPVATRMSPCPVHAGINIASSSTGDSSSWDQCRIMWQLEADGSALADWPSKYRYVTDPRPGLNSKQIDLSGQTDTGNYNRPRGFNFGWVLTTGTWRIKCTVTNPEGLTTTTTSSDITIAADTRTEYTVQASGGDYTTLAAALTARAATDNVKITVEDGHTENLTAALTTITGDNFVIQQAGTGTKPVLTRTGTPTGSESVLLGDGESYLVEGIVFADGTGLVSGGTYRPTAFAASESGAFVSCSTTGDVTNLPAGGFGCSGATDGLLVFKCGTTITLNYSFASSASVGTVFKVSLVGNTFGPSEDESIIRTVGQPQRFNVCWNFLDNDGTKSCLRFAGGSYLAAYGNKWEDGDNWTGEASNVSDGADFTRIEANFAQGSVSAAGLVGGLMTGVYDLTCANNITSSATAAYQAVGNDGSTGVDPTIARAKFLHNTYLQLDGYTNDAIRGETQTLSTYTDNVIAANLWTHEDGSDLTVNVYDAREGGFTVRNNVFHLTKPNITAFARLWAPEGVTANVSFATFEGYAWTDGNAEADVTLDARYEPSSPTTVTTESGVYDDYYGNTRGSTSYVGAVNASPSASKKVMVLQ